MTTVGLGRESRFPSLLGPAGSRQERAAPSLSPGAAADLGIDTIAATLTLGPEHRARTAGLLAALCVDRPVIRYRQDVLQDIMETPGLEEDLVALLPRVAALGRYRTPKDKRGLLFEVTWRLGELERYAACVTRLSDALGRARPYLRSAGLLGLGDALAAIREEPVFQRLCGELPGLSSRMRGIASITVGINLDDDLQPSEAVLLSLNSERFGAESPSLLRRLLAGSRLLRQWTGVAPLHRAADAEHPMLVPLFRDLSEVLQAACRPVATALEQYTMIGTGFLADLAEELAFYLGAARLFRSLRADGLPLCRPVMAPLDERTCELRDAWNVTLALRFRGEAGAPRRDIVTNDVTIGPVGGVLLLTGPNHGGKTTWMQGVGQALVLAQAGLLVPGTRAVVSPADAILTHFPAPERPAEESGRLGEESRRLRDMFLQATPASLLLLNESLTATSPRESYLLARDVVRALRVLGARAIYTTHLHELAAEAEALNAETEGEARISSVVALAEDGPRAETDARRTYRIEARPPAGHSYARGIALQYGISFEQLVDCLRERGVVSAERLRLAM